MMLLLPTKKRINELYVIQCNKIGKINNYYYWSSNYVQLVKFFCMLKVFMYPSVLIRIK